MLKIFYGRENLDKSKFIFDNLDGKTLLLVPDQFTLEAEKDAFFYLGRKGLMDIDIVSISRLGSKVLKETGGGRRPMIGRQGRHMLLTKILRDRDDELELYRGYSTRPGFVEMINNFISEMKQYQTSPDELEEVTGAVSENSFLHKKLSDMLKIYRDYEERIQGKYTDSEDYITLYTERIAGSPSVAASSVWIYGFDYFTPKNIRVIEQLTAAARNVNLVLTWDGGKSDIFRLTGLAAGRFGDCRKIDIGGESSFDGGGYEIKKKTALEHIERQLFALPADTCADSTGITLVKAANYYAEAETAAAYVLDLVRDECLRLRDIVLICNDLDTRGKIFKRVFAQYGMELFMDAKRDILHVPAVKYVTALMDVISEGYRREDVMELIKTGLTDIDAGEAEDLENYCLEYDIKSTLWKKDFEKGKDRFGQETVDRLNDMRQRIIDPLLDFTEKYREAGTVENRIRVLYGYLSEDVKLPEKLAALMEEQRDSGDTESMQETSQAWDMIIEVFDQLDAILGSEKISMKDMDALLKSGFEAAEIGMLPPSADGIMMGTMQRTRSGRIRAMLVTGANEGILPAQISNDGLLSSEEKNRLEDLKKEKGIGEICKMDRLRTMEEELAIYRNMAKPADRLYMSCSVSDEEGGAIRPSYIFDRVRSMFPDVRVEKDIINRGKPAELVAGRGSTLKYLTYALRAPEEGQEPAGVWKDVLRWYEKNGGTEIEKVKDGLFFRNEAGRINSEAAKELYRKEGNDYLSLSPSRLEKYGRCPFAHFVNYGLVPEKIEMYKVGPVDMGDLYHSSLMHVAEKLSEGCTRITDPDSRWMCIDESECDALSDAVLKTEIGKYREGIMDKDAAETYRSLRMRDMLRSTVRMMVEQVRRGEIESMEYEVGFGKGRPIPPVEAAAGDILVEGKIDRVDVLPGDHVKVIDYKSGSDKYSEAEARSGWKLQLFVYLKAAMEGKRSPAGTFYFHIDYPMRDAGAMSVAEAKKAAEDAVREAFKMDGIMLDDPDVIRGIDSEVYENCGRSAVAPLTVKSGKNGNTVSGNKVLSAEEFAALMDAVGTRMDEMCRELADGSIEIHPRVNKNISACTYCDYKGICKFDTAFEGCRYEKI